MAYKKEVNLVLRGHDLASKAFNRPIRSLKDLRIAADRVKGPIAAAGAAAITAFAGASIAAAEEMRKMDVAMTAATGSVENARAAMGFAKETADELGLNLVSTVKGFTSISAAAKGTALEGKQAQEVFLGVSTAVSGLGLSADDAHGALRAIEQMISKGKVSAEELRQQLGERLPGAFQIAARAMGVTTGELDDMLKQGKLLSEDFLPKFASELKQAFSGAAAQNANSLSANMKRLKSSFHELKVAVGEELLPVANQLAVSATMLINKMANLRSESQGVSDALLLVKETGRSATHSMSMLMNSVSAASLSASNFGRVFKETFGIIGEKESEQALARLQERARVVDDTFANLRATFTGGQSGGGAASDASDFIGPVLPKDAITDAGSSDGTADKLAAQRARISAFTQGVFDDYERLHFSKLELISEEERHQIGQAARLIENEKEFEFVKSVIQDNAAARRKQLLDEEVADHNKALDRKIKDADRMSKEMDKLERRRQNDRIRGTQQMFSSMTSLAATFGGRQSAIFKGLAITEALINTYTGASRALRDYPYPFSLGIAGLVTAQGFAQVASIKSAGQAHGGVEYVPQDQTVLLQRGERVIKRDQNEEITAALTEGGGGGPREPIHVHLHVDGREIANVIVDADRDGLFPKHIFKG